MTLHCQYRSVALQCAVNWKRIPAPVNDTFHLKIATLLPHSKRHNQTVSLADFFSACTLRATQLECCVPLLLLSASAGLCARLHLLVYSWRVPTTLFGCCPDRQHCQLAVRCAHSHTIVPSHRGVDTSRESSETDQKLVCHREAVRWSN